MIATYDREFKIVLVGDESVGTRSITKGNRPSSRDLLMKLTNRYF
jgi:hypothetical protein